MGNPKISVIVPIYNVEKFLPSCLDSIINQSLKDIEVICVDDGSPDNSAQILKKYVEKDSRIKVIKQKNQGLSGARNTGIKKAIGTYIFFVDSDDLLEKDALKIPYDKAHKEKLDMVLFDIKPQLYDKQYKESYRRYLKYYKRSKEYSTVRSGKEMFLEMHKNQDYIPNAYQYLIKRELLKKHGLTFYPRIIHEDNLFTIQALFLAKRVSHINKELYIRNVREGSIMTSAPEIKKVNGLFITIREILKTFNNNPLEFNTTNEISNYLFNVLQNNLLSNLIKTSISDIENYRKNLNPQDLLLFDALTKNQLRSNKKIIKLENNLKHKNKLPDYSQSYDYKIGHVILFIPRKLYKLLKSYKMGKILINTLKNIFKKLKYSYKEKKSQKELTKKDEYQRLKRYLFFNKLKFFKFLKIKRNTVQEFSIKPRPHSPKVSIIIPTYNSEKYLPKCFEDILNQSMKDIEVICVDDGSTDNTTKILKNFAKKYKRVQIFLKNKETAGSARNLGLKNSSGKYLMFLDSDDMFEKNLIKELYEKASSLDADVCICDAYTYNDSTEEIKPGNFLKKEKIPSVDPFNKIHLKSNLYLFCTPCPWNKMFKRRYILENNIKFQSIVATNDLFFVYYSLTLANRITTVEKKLLKYRIGISTNLQSKNDLAPFEFVKALLKLKESLEKDNLFKGFIKQSFVNMAINVCSYNLGSLKDKENYKLVKYWLKTEGLQKLDLTDHCKEFYVDNNLEKLNRYLR
jgi:glycosyltransferase involved in cell wall biosynthesis